MPDKPSTPRPPLLAIVLAASLAQPATRAFAEPAEFCAVRQIQIPEKLPARWSESIQRLCAQLANESSVDPQVELVVRVAADGSLRLAARLPDGRTTERRAEDEAALSRTAAALLLLPAESSPPAAAEADGPWPAPASPQRPAASGGTAVHTLPEFGQQSADGPARSTLHLRLGLCLIGHVAGTPAYVGGGFSALLGLRYRAVFFEVSPQWEAQQVSTRMRLPDFEMHNFGVSAVVGLRVWDADDGAVETGVGALFLAESQTYRPVAEEVGGTLIDGQLTALARLVWGRSALRWSARIDAALGLTRLSKEAHIRDNFPALPCLAIGVGFGVHWESI